MVTKGSKFIKLERLAAYGSTVTLMGLFYFLFLQGAIITSSGDVTCIGTLEHPCTAYFNITNPTKGSWYIYELPFELGKPKLSFSPNDNVESYQLYVKYYNKWVPMDFTMETRLGNVPDDRLYAFVFPAKATKEFKVEVTKKDPTKDIKWSLDFSGGNLDPVMISPKVDDVFIELISNTDQCFQNCEAVYKIKNPTNETINPLLTARFNNGLKGYELQMLKPDGTWGELAEYAASEVKKKVWEPNVTCTKEQKYCETNKTYYNETTCEDNGKYIEQKSTIYYKNGTFNMKDKEEVTIKIKGKKNIKLGKNNIEWIPKIKIDSFELENTKWAWWNSSWTKCKDITLNGVSGTLTNWPILVNVTYDSDMLADLSDLRYVNTSCNNDGNELSFDRVFTQNSIYAESIIIGDSFANGTVYSMYYGNAAASDADNNTAWQGIDSIITRWGYEENPSLGVLEESVQGINGTASDFESDKRNIGVLGYGWYFDGNNDDVIVGDNNAFDHQTFSIISFLYPGQLPGEWMYRDQSGANNGDWQFGYDKTSHDYVKFQFQDAVTQSYIFTTALNVSAYNSIMMSTDGLDTYIYLAGVQKSTDSRDWNQGLNTLDIGIGCRNDGFTGCVKGYYDETMFFSKKVSQAEYNFTDWNYLHNSDSVSFGSEESDGGECSPSINTDWAISDTQTCDATDADVGTGNITITTGGKLVLINNSTVTAAGLKNYKTDGSIAVSIYDGSKLLIEN